MESLNKLKTKNENKELLVSSYLKIKITFLTDS